MLRKHSRKKRIPAEAKVSFVKYVAAKEKDEIQKLRGQVVYHLFNAEMACGLAKTKSSNIESWYSCIKDILEPNIGILCEEDQRKIIAMLTMQIPAHLTTHSAKS